MTSNSKYKLIEGQPVLVVIDIQGGEQEGDEAALRAMEYLQTGARRNSAEVIGAFEAYKNRAAAEANS